MDKSVELIKFQVEKLGYQFWDLDLLSKALTHSIDNFEINKDFPLKNRTNQRLRVVGETVLKLVASEFVIRTSTNWQGQGDWTVRKNDLLLVDKQIEIGKKLLTENNQTKSLNSIVRVSWSNWNNANFKVPYADFVKALFGAVFLDSKNCPESNGMQNCFDLFQKLWKPYFSADITIENLAEKFPPPSTQIFLFWFANGLMKSSFVNDLLTTLGIQKINDSDLLREAIIHKSFYDDIRNNAKDRQPDYERLEFLGDAVLDVVITEYFWVTHPEYDFTHLKVKASALVEGSVQNQIYNDLDLGKFVQIKNAQNWASYGDIVESIIGALYVDIGYAFTSEFILKHWKLQNMKPSTDLETLQRRLNYKFTDENILLAALTHESFYTGSNQRQQRQGKLLEYKCFGNAALNLVAIQYAFQCVKVSVSGDSIEAIKNFLCGKKSLKKICSSFKLQHVVNIHESLKSGQTAFKSYEIFLLSVLGAIWTELQDKNNLCRFSETFYKVWNPLLNNVPKRDFMECFIPNPVSAYDELRMLKGYEMDEISFRAQIENQLEYEFSNFMLLKQSIFPRTYGTLTSNSSIGDSERFGLVGKYAMEYLTCYLATCFDVNTSKDFSNCFKVCTKAVHAVVTKTFPNNVYNFWKSPGGTLKQTKKQNEIFQRAIMGAVFLDIKQKKDPKWDQEWISYYSKLAERAGDEDERTNNKSGKRKGSKQRRTNQRDSKNENAVENQKMTNKQMTSNKQKTLDKQNMSNTEKAFDKQKTLDKPKASDEQKHANSKVIIRIERSEESVPFSKPQTTIQATKATNATIISAQPRRTAERKPKPKKETFRPTFLKSENRYIPESNVLESISYNPTKIQAVSERHSEVPRSRPHATIAPTITESISTQFRESLKPQIYSETSIASTWPTYQTARVTKMLLPELRQRTTTQSHLTSTYNNLDSFRSEEWKSTAFTYAMDVKLKEIQKALEINRESLPVYSYDKNICSTDPPTTSRTTCDTFTHSVKSDFLFRDRSTIIPTKPGIQSSKIFTTPSPYKYFYKEPLDRLRTRASVNDYVPKSEFGNSFQAQRSRYTVAYNEDIVYKRDQYQNMETNWWEFCFIIFMLIVAGIIIKGLFREQ